jgi:hypothetical protein
MQGNLEILILFLHNGLYEFDETYVLFHRNKDKYVIIFHKMSGFKSAMAPFSNQELRKRVINGGTKLNQKRLVPEKFLE